MLFLLLIELHGDEGQQKVVNVSVRHRAHAVFHHQARQIAHLIRGALHIIHQLVLAGGQQRRVQRLCHKPARCVNSGVSDDSEAVRVKRCDQL